MQMTVDGRVLHGAATGTAVYARGLLHALAGHPVVGAVRVVTYAGDPRGPAPVADLRADGIEVVQLGRMRSRVPGVAARTGLPIPFDAVAPTADGYLFPNFRWLPTRTGRTATVVHDLSVYSHPWTVPDAYRAKVRRFTAEALARSTVVVAPSETVAHEIRVEFSDHRAHIVVARPGIPRQEGHEGSRSSDRRRGVLFVGTVQPRKNVAVLVEAYRRLPADLRRMHPLRIIGRVGWEDSDVLDRLQAIGPEVSGYVGPEALAHAYGSAAVLVAPSLSEGFDLPVLEAMASGVPVVCSDIAVHREVAGDAGAFFGPNDDRHLAGLLSTLLGDTERWMAAAAAGMVRSRDFDWSRTAQAVVTAIAGV